MKNITITYNGNSVVKDEICPGVVKSGSAFLIKCSVTGDWCYCNQDRYDKLIAKYGSPEALGLKHVSRAGKRTQDGKEPLKKKTYKQREVYETDSITTSREPFKFIHPDVASAIHRAETQGLNAWHRDDIKLNPKKHKLKVPNHEENES